MRASGGPGSVSAGTQASSAKLGPASADARVPCESATGSGGFKGSADPYKTASRDSADPPKTATMGSTGPSETATKGSAGASKTSPRRGSPTEVRVEGFQVDVEGFVHPRRSTSSGRSQVSPKPIASDRQNKAEKNLIL